MTWKDSQLQHQESVITPYTLSTQMKTNQARNFQATSVSFKVFGVAKDFIDSLQQEALIPFFRLNDLNYYSLNQVNYVLIQLQCSSNEFLIFNLQVFFESLVSLLLTYFDSEDYLIKLQVSQVSLTWVVKINPPYLYSQLTFRYQIFKF